MTLHRILAGLEQPQSHPGGHAGAELSAAPPVDVSSGGDGPQLSHVPAPASSNGDGSDYGGARGPRAPGLVARGPRSWLSRRFRGEGEESVPLPGSVAQELELSAMAPSENFLSGAISPAESADSVH